MHTGHPVTQVIVHISDMHRNIYILEVMGHRKDEALLLEERQAIIDRILLT